MAPVATAQAPAQPSAHRVRLIVGAVLEFVAAGLVLTGSLLPMFWGTVDSDGIGVRIVVTSWHHTAESADGGPVTATGQAPAVGAPLVFGLVLLAAAAALALAASSGGREWRLARAAGVTALTAAAFVTAVVWAVVMLVVSYWSTFEPTGFAESGSIESEVAVGVGLWLLVAAAVVSVGAAVLLMVASRRGARLPGPQLAWQPIQQRAEPATPRYGVPVPADTAGWTSPPGPLPDSSPAGAAHAQWARPAEQQSGVVPAHPMPVAAPLPGAPGERAQDSVPDTQASPPAREPGPEAGPQVESGHTDDGGQRA
jgi:preprotein translocase subunit SecG